MSAHGPAQLTEYRLLDPEHALPQTQRPSRPPRPRRRSATADAERLPVGAAAYVPSRSSVPAPQSSPALDFGQRRRVYTHRWMAAKARRRKLHAVNRIPCGRRTGTCFATAPRPTSRDGHSPLRRLT